MNNRFYLLSLFLLLLSTGCVKETIAELVLPSDGGMTARVNGDNFDSNGSEADFEAADNASGLSMLTISGAETNLTDISIVSVIIISHGQELPPAGSYTAIANEDCILSETACTIGTYHVTDVDGSSDGQSFTIYEEYPESTTEITLDYREDDGGRYVFGTFSLVLFEEETGVRVTITRGQYDMALNE